MRVNPYLLFDGNCEEAFGAYAKIFGGKIVAMMPFEGSPAGEKTPADWRKKILHARLEFSDNALMASDAPPVRFQNVGDAQCRGPGRGGAHLRWAGLSRRGDDAAWRDLLGLEIRHADRPLRHALDDQLREALLTGPEGLLTRWTN